MERVFRVGLALFGVVVGGVCSQSGVAQGQAPKPSPLVASVTATGNGCPAGSWSTTLSEDGQSVDVAFSDFTVELSEERRKSTSSCSVAIALNGSEGVAYAPVQIAVAGDFPYEGVGVSYNFEAYWSATPDVRRVVASGSMEAGPPGPIGITGFGSDVSTSDLVSPCTGERVLHIDGTIEGVLAEWQQGVIGRLGGSGTKVRIRPQGCNGKPGPDQPTLRAEAWTTPVEALPASGLTIKSVETAGGGCRPGKSKVALSPDGRNFQISFDDYSITGGGPSEYTPSCTLMIKVQAPAGQTYALESFVLSGNAALPKDRGAHISATGGIMFQGRSIANQQTLELPGVHDGAFTFERTIPAGERQFSDCDEKGDSTLDLYIGFTGPETWGVAGSRFQVTKVGGVKYALRSCPEASAP